MAGKRGRPTLLNKETVENICRSLQLGMPQKYAAEANGVNERTLREWLEKAEAGVEPYASFSAAITRARARGVAFLHEKVVNGGRGSQGAQFVLERRFRDEYGNIQRIEHAGHDGKAIEITAKAIADMSEEELLKIVSDGRSLGSAGGTRALPP